MDFSLSQEQKTLRDRIIRIAASTSSVPVTRRTLPLRRGLGRAC